MQRASRAVVFGECVVELVRERNSLQREEQRDGGESGKAIQA